MGVIQNHLGMNRQLERSVANDFLKSLGTKVQRISLLKGGLIHKTFLVEAMNDAYFVLQGVNTHVFSNPNLVVLNQLRISQFLTQNGYPKTCLTLLKNADGSYLLQDQKGQTWRMFHAIHPSKSLEVLSKHSQAFEAAKALSEFHFFLKDFPMDQLKESIPGFLDFKKRKKDYQHSLKVAIPYRFTQANQIIQKLGEHEGVLNRYLQLLPKLPKRIIHADPKLSNFFFNASGEGVCAIIDWDTIMTGSILYDLGDMIRSFCQVGTEDSQQEKTFNPQILKELLTGYFEGPMNDCLSELERENILLGAKAVIYIQGLRFLSDYLIGDQYYWVEDENHNLRRARNQLQMLEEICLLD
jgi:Ser/Thr protein kinase RdoA (MazF antagonist)